jgi:hypothetical protein
MYIVRVPDDSELLDGFFLVLGRRYRVDNRGGYPRDLNNFMPFYSASVG